MEDYISVAEAAKRWGISSRRVYTLCAEGRIPGATRFVGVWAIPQNAEKPADARIKTGQYIGFSEKYRKRTDRKQ
ncbi:MAG: helix-turn-helix domain-containing protein [Oscillospiraceae bacterium]